MNPIVDRIKKLLRLGNNEAATMAEAAAALKKAQELAVEHGIDLGAIPADVDGPGGMTHVSEPSQAGMPHRLASGIVKHHFGVDTLFDSTGAKPVSHFIGCETNCQIAVYVYIYLVRAMRAAWRNRTNRRLRDRDSFLRGFALGVETMIPEKFHQTGLVLCTKRYVEGVILAGKNAKITPIKTGGKKKLSDRSFFEGYRDGKITGIHNAVRGSNTELLPE